MKGLKIFLSFNLTPTSGFNSLNEPNFLLVIWVDNLIKWRNKFNIRITKSYLNL